MRRGNGTRVAAVKLTEHQAKTLLAERGVLTPAGRLARSPSDAVAAAGEIGERVVVKAQVRTGGRGNAGGIIIVDSAREAGEAADRLLGTRIGDEPVGAVLVEQAEEISAEHYLAVTIDPSSGQTMLLRSARGGVEVETMADSITREFVEPGHLVHDEPAATLLAAFIELDALLIEINPLAKTTDGRLIAIDAKIELDDAARFRHVDLFEGLASTESEGTDRERAAADIGLRLVELGGDIAVLANGAGLTMATMDAIVAAGGRPANFLEIGGDAYTKAAPALEIVLSQPGVSSLLVNFCGAFARCDVMTAGVIDGWETLRSDHPNLPINFSISGTGQDEARQLVRNRLNLEPHNTMAEAVAAAIAGAESSGAFP